MSESSWDVFISHAHEDKAVVAKPLAEALSRGGLRVWIDEQEISLGDSLTTKINQGLARSRYGIVILSPDFLAKEWPKRELAALLAIELKHGKRVLPVLHNLELESILRDFPLMGDKVCVSTEAGIEALASEVLRATGFKRGRDAVPATPLSPEVGTRIGPYVIEAPLGAGGSGVVYRVRGSSFPYPLALKLFHPLRAPYGHLFPLFARGFRAVSAIHHPNVVGAHDHGVFDFGGAKRAYFTMDLIDGVPLDVWCRRPNALKDRYRLALPVFRQVAAALSAAHETSYVDELGFEVRSVLHGDVKPANIMVDATGFARLVDFLQLDVQRLIDPRVLPPKVLDGPRPLTAAMGTPGFMAPEQERHGIVTVATDVYGLGVTYASALADRRTSNPFIDLYRASEIPPAFRELVLKMIDPKPENRPARMRDVLEALGAGDG
jgi:TIR domain/Protein kinase domain